MGVVWSLKALKSFQQVINYLSLEWSVSVEMNFIHEVERIILLISKNPNMFKKSNRYKNTRIGFVTKHNSFVYRVTNKKIELLIFWDNRQDSRKLIY
ncbi:MAG: type II toxin-antitoxin system RelE/ParE family toxin [Prolixibacteraceae bacterium]